ncbi:hypothetical protein RHSIM_Rhsim04G0089300 [Rhododendron simsii]|uniref:DUF4283 domain-containing protein n=1 Tax=Rhododendron simsii TaxID=118357 RepID=A0A834L531_RHOSS|nr:hypothetical protein RHSIM_RhsimUnG0029000 [Rhododendron simsii]KAF7145547.1 hypothetical protein RHSIM_Rhsim04G0089300 [Rhododendron simsii]
MADEVVARIGNFHLSDEEEDVITIDEEICQQALVACSFSLVGKLLTTKRFKVAAMKESLGRAWGFSKNLSIEEVGDNLFHFRFEDETSCSRVLNGGPWNFENHLLVVQPWEPGMKADQVLFSSVAFWVQLWGLPFEFVTPAIGEVIGRRIGAPLSVDNREVVGEQGRFIRIRVEVPLDKPLKRGGFISLGRGDKIWVDYKFERLNSFCFYCRNLAHEMGDCALKTMDEEKGAVKEAKYGAMVESRWRRISLNGKDVRVGELLDPRKKRQSVGMEGVIGPTGAGLLTLGDSSSGLNKGGPVNFEVDFDVGTERTPCVISKESGGHVEVGLESALKEVIIMDSLDNFNLEANDHFSFGALHSKTPRSSSMEPKKRQTRKRGVSSGAGRGKQPGKENSGILGKKRTLNGKDAMNSECEEQKGGCGGEKRLVLWEKNSVDTRVVTVNPRGLSSGECLLAKLGVKLEILELSTGVMDVRVSDLKGRCSRVIGIYAKDWELQDFRNFIDDIDLIDVGYVGYPFTWNNKREGRANIRIRLDRVVVNSRWRTDFSSGSLHHLKPGGSDHCPILLKYGLGEDYKVPRFIFDAQWAAKEVCGEIENVKGDFDAVEYRRVEDCMRKASAEEEEYWKNKAKVSWLRLGDKNTAFFHAKIVQRRAANRINGLEDSTGTWRESDVEVEGIVFEYFHHIFTSSNPSGTYGSFSNGPNVMSGPGGMTVGFFQKYWDVVGWDITNAVHSFMHSGKLLRAKVLANRLCRILPKASDHGILKIKRILEDYGKVSGQIINSGKSCCFFSVNTPVDKRDRLSQLLGIRRDSSLGNYLGLPTDLSQTRYKIFSYIKDKMRGRTEGWNEFIMNQAGKEVMLNSVALALLSYAMSCVKLLAKLCNELDAMMAKFWWGSKGNE